MNRAIFSALGPHDSSLFPLIRNHNGANAPFDRSSIKQIDRNLYRIAVLLFKVLGDRVFGSDVQGKLGEVQYGKLKEIIQELQEIRRKISDGIESSQLKTESVCKKLFTHWSSAQSIDKAVREMAADAFCLVPFPQEGLLMAEEFEGQALDLARERSRAFETLMRLVALDPSIPKEESKTKEMDPELKENERILLAKLLNSWAALIQQVPLGSPQIPSKKEPVFFRTLLHSWAGVDPMRVACVETVYRMAGLSNWQPQQPDKRDSFSSQAKECPSFRDFLIQTTSDNLQTYLQIKDLTPQTRISLGISFKDENIRSDIAFFIAKESEISTIDWVKSQLSSRHLLESFKWYFLILRGYSVAAENRASLFQWAIERDPKEPLNILEPIPPSPFSKEAKQYQGAIGILKRLLKAATEKTNEAGAVFPLLHFCLGHKTAGEALADLFDELKHLGVRFSAHQILQFSRMNKTFDFQAADRLLKISKHYIIDKLIDFERFHHLYLDPPTPIDMRILKALNGDRSDISEKSAESARPIINSYSAFMSRFIPTQEIQFWLWMRDYIHRPCPLMFELIDQASKWNRGEIDQQFLSQFFPPRDEFFQIQTTKFMISRANETILSISKAYSLSLTEVFTLYLKAISFRSDTDYQPWRTAQQFIQRLRNFCPGVSNNVVVFLLLHYKPEAETFLQQLQACKDEYQAMDRSRFFLNPKIMAEIHEKIEALCGLFPDSLSHEAEPFRRKLSENLKLSFAPFAQPVTDFLKVKNVTKEEGIKWSESYLATHEGGLKSVVENGSLKLYFHWQAIENHPFLTLVAYDGGTKKGRWSTLQFPISLKELEKPPFRNAIFGYLSSVAPNALRETTESINQSDWDQYSEEQLGWREVFPVFNTVADQFSTQIETQVISRQHLDAIDQFMLEVKISYRNIYWSLLCHQEQSYLPNRPPGEKILDGFFEDNSLLSQKEVEIEPAGIYSVNFSEEEVDRYREMFFKPSSQNDKSSLLRTDMQISLDGMTQIFLPIFFHVRQGIASVKSISAHGWYEDERKEPQSSDAKPEKSVVKDQENAYSLVTLSVQFSKDDRQESVSFPLKYPEEAQNHRVAFRDLCNLHFNLLKAMVYFLHKRQKLLSSCIAPP